ncbi:MAG TPA: hypothetical protein VFF65_03985 [Phycisphaerales bacterium]|nr:hypothetical protein [Phycisphaerales bacterium]
MVLWRQLIAEWRTRLAGCRAALGLGPTGEVHALLRMRERVLTFLLTRYGDREEEEPAQTLPDRPLPLPPRGSHLYYGLEPPRPEPQVSDSHMPRRSAELRTGLEMLQRREAAKGRRWWQVWWW